MPALLDPRDLAVVVARIVMGLFYIAVAIGLVKDFRIITPMMQVKRVPFPGAALAVTILVWLVCGGALVLGQFVAPSAVILLTMTLIMTPIIHDFWRAAPQDRANEIQHFLNNLAIAAGLLCVAAH